MDKTKYNILFDQIIQIKHGMKIDFEKVEANLKHLREGGSLTYIDLENIADDNCWPFNKYWMWPSRYQIEEKLKKTSGWFKNLPNSEEKAIRNLDEIFKNIALVSIILRFVHPKHYAMYSRPPLKILRIERGIDDVEEYLNYVEELRILRDSFGVDKTSEADIIVWAIAQEKGKSIKELKKLLAEQLPKNLSAEEIIIYLSKNPLKVSETYNKQKDYRTAGFWATVAFKKFLREECLRLTGKIPPRKNGEIFTFIDYLCRKTMYRYKKNTLHDLRELRNKVAHESEILTQVDAKNFITILKSLMLKIK